MIDCIFSHITDLIFIAISLAMSRDGSSGGCIRLVNITKDKEEREFIEYGKLPNKM
jgi:20S proteasome subunit beta 1